MYLDDVFAALDAIVGKQVFEKVVLELLQGKTRIVVTHKEDIINHTAVSCTLEFSHDGNLIETENVNYAVNVAGVSDEARDLSLRSITAVPYVDSLSALLAQQSTTSTSNNDSTSVEDEDEDDVLCMDYSYSGKKTDNKKQGLDVEEDMGSGGIDMSVFKGYMAAAGGIKAVAMLLCIQTVWKVSGLDSIAVVCVIFLNIILIVYKCMCSCLVFLQMSSLLNGQKNQMLNKSAILTETLLSTRLLPWVVDSWSWREP